MRNRKRSPRADEVVRASCGEWGADDGVDPREWRRAEARGGQDRHARSLCRQVQQTLSYVLSGACHDERLRSLDVIGVVPAPDSRRLLVTVAPGPSAEPRRVDELLAALAGAAGRLRGEVAAAIHRRKAPELVFVVAAPPVGDEPSEPSTGEEGRRHD